MHKYIVAIVSFLFISVGAMFVNVGTAKADPGFTFCVNGVCFGNFPRSYSSLEEFCYYNPDHWRCNPYYYSPWPYSYGPPRYYEYHHYYHNHHGGNWQPHGEDHNHHDRDDHHNHH